MTTALLRAEQALIQIVHVECYIDDMHFQNLCTKKIIFVKEGERCKVFSCPRNWGNAPNSGQREKCFEYVLLPY